jgi:hypothetical protein
MPAASPNATSRRPSRCRAPSLNTRQPACCQRAASRLGGTSYRITATTAAAARQPMTMINQTTIPTTAAALPVASVRHRQLDEKVKVKVEAAIRGLPNDRRPRDRGDLPPLEQRQPLPDDRKLQAVDAEQREHQRKAQTHFGLARARGHKDQKMYLHRNGSSSNNQKPAGIFRGAGASHVSTGGAGGPLRFGQLTFSPPSPRPRLQSVTVAAQLGVVVHQQMVPPGSRSCRKSRSARPNQGRIW